MSVRPIGLDTVMTDDAGIKNLKTRPPEYVIF